MGLVIAGYIGYLIGIAEGEAGMFAEPKLSPSGEYTYEQIYGYDRARYVRVAIESIDGADSFITDEKFYVRFTTLIDWGENDTLWIYSGDVGTFLWRRENGTWKKEHADESSIQFAPDAIKDKW